MFVGAEIAVATTEFPNQAPPVAGRGFHARSQPVPVAPDPHQTQPDGRPLGGSEQQLSYIVEIRDHEVAVPVAVEIRKGRAPTGTPDARNEHGGEASLAVVSGELIRLVVRLADLGAVTQRRIDVAVGNEEVQVPIVISVERERGPAEEGEGAQVQPGGGRLVGEPRRPRTRGSD